MGELMNLNPKVPIADADIPALIARDSETAAAIAAHTGAVDPHPVYLTQAEGDGRYRRSAVALTDSDIPAAIARDSETTVAIDAHIAAIDPHPQYLTQAEGDARYPRFLRKVLTGVIPLGAQQRLTVPHGVPADKIIAFSAFVTVPVDSVWPGWMLLPGDVTPWTLSNSYYQFSRLECDPINISAETYMNDTSQLGMKVVFVIDYLL